MTNKYANIKSINDFGTYVSMLWPSTDGYTTIIKETKYDQDILGKAVAISSNLVVWEITAYKNGSVMYTILAPEHTAYIHSKF